MAEPVAAAPEAPTATPAPAAATPPASAPTTPAPSTQAADAGTKPAAEPTSLLATSKPEGGEKPAPVSLEDAKKYLTEKGAKAEDLAKLDETALRAKYDEAKAAEAKAAPGSEIDIKLPEGVTVDEKLLADFKGIIADAKLSPSERAQKLADMHLAALNAATEASTKLWTDTQKKWADEVRADKELGGSNFDPMRATAAKAIDQLFPNKEEADRVRMALDFTGAGNNPEIIRAFYRAGKALSEGGPVAGKPTGSGGPKSAAATLYPSMNNAS